MKDFKRKMLILLVYIFLATFSKVTGVVIDLTKDKTYTHCVPNTDPVILQSPFDEIRNRGYSEVKNESWFSSLSWYFIAPGQKEILIIEYSLAPPFLILLKNKVPYDTWGLKITDANPSDSGVYSARLSTTRLIDAPPFDINITFAEYPKLKSDKFTTDVKTNENGSKAYFCGELATLGSPPVNILWKTETGDILPSTYRDGFQWLEEPAASDHGKVYCEVDKTSPSYRCIPPNELGRWDETYTGELTTANSNLMIYIIAGCVGGVALIAAIILTIFICKKRGVKKYNARGEESKTEVDGEHKARLMSSSDYAVSSNSNDKGYQENKNPIYRGSSSGVDPANYTEKTHQQKKTHQGANSNNSNNSPAPRHSYPRYQPETQDDYEAYEMNGKGRTPENVAPPAVAPKYRKKSEPLIDAQGNEVRPPTKKPRSIFLTPSMEELDKITEAVRGGKGSQPPGTMV